MLMEQSDMAGAGPTRARMRDMLNKKQCLTNAYMFMACVGILPAYAVVIFATRRAEMEDRAVAPDESVAYVAAIPLDLTQPLQLRLAVRAFLNPFNGEKTTRHYLDGEQLIYGAESAFLVACDDDDPDLTLAPALFGVYDDPLESSFELLRGLRGALEIHRRERGREVARDEARTVVFGERAPEADDVANEDITARRIRKRILEDAVVKLQFRAPDIETVNERTYEDEPAANGRNWRRINTEIQIAARRLADRYHASPNMPNWAASESDHDDDDDDEGATAAPVTRVIRIAESDSRRHLLRELGEPHTAVGDHRNDDDAGRIANASRAVLEIDGYRMRGWPPNGVTADADIDDAAPWLYYDVAVTGIRDLNPFIYTGAILFADVASDPAAFVCRGLRVSRTGEAHWPIRFGHVIRSDPPGNDAKVLWVFHKPRGAIPNAARELEFPSADAMSQPDAFHPGDPATEAVEVAYDDGRGILVAWDHADEVCKQKARDESTTAIVVTARLLRSDGQATETAQMQKRLRGV
ncbi:hypothetical protein CYMTET_2557 [Cymbomonas tetramitiformis]|uniref:Uncharacterized protein n=1 Tax=Cymbomonas tetramitiformis TaxID=36881 RepID=A0AAE0LMG1_9CHLO|nr:hypothetical protein CYMTET_2557 [Cymbomonas tetramitiformis]